MGKSHVTALLVHTIIHGAPFSKKGDLIFEVEHKGPIIEYALIHESYEQNEWISLWKFDSRLYYKYRDECCAILDDLITGVRVKSNVRDIACGYDEERMNEARLYVDFSTRGSDEKRQPLSVHR